MKTTNPKQKDVVIISVPYAEPFPLVAPVLLASCLEDNGISAIGIDFNAQFIKKFSRESWYVEFKNFLTIGYLVTPKFNLKIYKDIIRFTKKFLLELQQAHRPKFIGISIFTSESLDFGLVLSYLIRRYCPDIKIIAGGKGLEVTDPNGIYHYQNWIDNLVVDTIVVGDAESEIIDTIKQNKTGLVYARPQTKTDLDNVPLAQWSNYDLSIYPEIYSQLDNQINIDKSYLIVTASKGCVRQCTFCDVQDFWPEYLYRDPIKVAQEIIHNYYHTGIAEFKFTDNLINGSISNFRIMNQYLVDHLPNTISYGGYAIFRGKNQMPEQDFELASRAGNIRWAVGVESGSEKVRYDMKKKFTNEDLEWSVKMLYKYNIHQNWLLIVGYPSESDDDFKETLNLLRQYQIMKNKITVQVTPPFMLLNNSPLIKNTEIAKFYGLDHTQNFGTLNNKFWTSTKYVDNNYLTRSRRWKELVTLIEDLGYDFGAGMPVQKWRDEIENLDKIYNEQKFKIIPIHTN
jgi:radical SAM superfamily enzyme YgiQ (UPF0313 family)